MLHHGGTALFTQPYDYRSYPWRFVKKLTHRGFYKPLQVFLWSEKGQTVKRILTPHRRERGFTLIELMVVVMIVAVLIAIAIPSFLGFRRAAQDREAQRDIEAVLPTTVVTVVSEEVTTGLSYEDGLYVDENDDDGSIVCYVRASRSGKTFSVWDGPTGRFFGDTDLSVADCPSVQPSDYMRDDW